MSWKNAYKILTEYGSFRHAPREIREKLGREEMVKAQNKFDEEKYGCKVITHVHDGDCARCHFPETIIVRNAQTGKILAKYCSVECGWRMDFFNEEYKKK